MLVARNLGYLSQVHSTLNYSRKLAALGRLMAGVAHEVKNPLNAMTIHLELLKQKLAAVPEPIAVPAPAGGTRQLDLTKHVDVIGDEIRRLDRVVIGFLKFARPDELKLQPVQLSTIISESSRRRRRRPSSGALRCAWSARANLPDDQRRSRDAAPGAAESGAQRLSGDARRRHAASSPAAPRRAAASRSTSKTPASAFRPRISRRFSISISRPRTRAAASASRWSTASSSCTTAKSKCNRRPAAEHGSA